MARFDYPECNETRTWEDIAQVYRLAPEKFESGGLGFLETVDFHVWACFRDHPCLSRLAVVPMSDAMCYKYHEGQEAWHAWALLSEINMCGT